MPTWFSVLVAATIAVAAAWQGWALWRLHRHSGVATLLRGALFVWALGLGTSLLILLGEYGLLP